MNAQLKEIQSDHIMWLSFMHMYTLKLSSYHAVLCCCFRLSASVPRVLGGGRTTSGQHSDALAMVPPPLHQAPLRPSVGTLVGVEICVLPVPCVTC